MWLHKYLAIIYVTNNFLTFRFLFIYAYQKNPGNGSTESSNAIHHHNNNSNDTYNRLLHFVKIG